MAHGDTGFALGPDASNFQVACGCRLARQGATVVFTHCKAHAEAPNLLAALQRIMGCADWDGGDIATLNITELQAALPQARDAIEAAS